MKNKLDIGTNPLYAESSKSRTNALWDNDLGDTSPVVAMESSVSSVSQSAASATFSIARWFITSPF